jgi:hypothetical protein
VNPSGWDNFYVIVGSAAAALIGVQFVVIALIAGLRTRLTADSINAFGTPSVVHLTASLVVSALMTAPWRSLFPRTASLAVIGAAGLWYAAIVARRAKRQTVYVPVFEDWLWHALLPFASYALLLVATIASAMFGIAGAVLGLLLVGIHNAWDTVTHMLVTAARASEKHERH